MSKKPKVAHIKKKVILVDRKRYWQKRALEKVGQAIMDSDDAIKEARDFMIHADIYTDEVMNAFRDIKEAYNKLAKAILEVKIK